MLGFHYFNGVTDRNASGTLLNYSSWSAVDSVGVNDYFLSKGFGGNIGDRDDFIDGNNFIVYESQLVKDRWDTWRSILYDNSSGVYKQLDPYTHSRSIAFGNPTVTKLQLPNGTDGYFVSYYIFSEGARPGEAGSLIFYTSASNLSNVMPRELRPPHNWTVFSPVCTCATPGGSVPNNNFACSDGDNRYCGADEYCVNSSVKPNWPCSML